MRSGGREMRPRVRGGRRPGPARPGPFPSPTVYPPGGEILLHAQQPLAQGLQHRRRDSAAQATAAPLTCHLTLPRPGRPRPPALCSSPRRGPFPRPRPDPARRPCPQSRPARPCGATFRVPAPLLLAPAAGPAPALLVLRAAPSASRPPHAGPRSCRARRLGLREKGGGPAPRRRRLPAALTPCSRLSQARCLSS